MASLKPGEDRAASILKERIRRVFKELPGALSGNEEAIHQVRVAGRRLRVALPLIARKSGGRLRRARRSLRDLTRAAGTGRDFDVLVRLFEERLGILDPPSTVQKQILRRLRAARTRSRHRMVSAVLAVRIDRLQKDLRGIRCRGPADVFTALARARGLREQEGEALQRGLAEVGDRFDPEALHALRRGIRRLRYAGEVEDAIRGQDSGATQVWKRLQEAIGVLHDVHLLAGWLGGMAERTAPRESDTFVEAVRREQEAFEAEGRRLHAELMRTRPAETVARALEAMARGRPAA